MPDWCWNRWEISGEDAQVAEAFDLLTEDVGEEELEVTFNKLLPTPSALRRIHTGHQTFDGQPERYWVYENGKSRPLTDAERAECNAIGWAYPGDWQTDHWGTRDGYRVHLTERHGGFARLEFESAWSPPARAFGELVRRFPELSVSGFFDCRDGQYAGYLSETDFDQEPPPGPLVREPLAMRGDRPGLDETDQGRVLDPSGQEPEEAPAP